MTSLFGTVSAALQTPTPPHAGRGKKAVSCRDRIRETRRQRWDDGWREGRNESRRMGSESKIKKEKWCMKRRKAMKEEKGGRG